MAVMRFTEFLNHSENGFLLPADTLARNVDNEPVEVLAECFVRLYLSNGKVVREIIQEQLGPEVIQEFMVKMKPTCYYKAEELQKDLWNDADALDGNLSSQCQAAVRQRFMRLFSADGLIPVYATGTDEGYLIPFTLREEADASRRTAHDLAGEEIPEWSGLLKELAIPCSLELHYWLSDALPVNGRSAMLPMLMAWWRKKGELPAFSPFRVVATGEIDANGGLAPVGTVAKVKAAKECLFEPLFFHPECPKERQPRGTYVLKLGAKVEVIKEEICKELEAWKADKAFSVDYALNRLTGLAQEVRFLSCDDWNKLAARLENVHCCIDKIAHPEEYLQYLVLLGEAYCHGGNTARAAEFNRFAQKFAAERPEFRKILYRLQIEEIVITVDTEEFEKIPSDAAELEKVLLKEGDVDLLMRFYGSMGQVHAYATLSGMAGFSQEESRRCFECAVKYAYQVENADEKSQDLNYLYLWDVLFGVYGSLEAEEDFGLAKAQLERMEASAHRRSGQHLMRFRAMAAYRHFLKTEKVEIPSENELQELLFDNDSFWCGAMALKCLAALYAAKGDLAQARKFFEKALERLQKEKEIPGVLAIQRLSILLEAFRSLKEDSWRQQALELLEGHPELANYPSAVRFRAFAEGKAEYPALRFWY